MEKITEIRNKFTLLDMFHSELAYIKKQQEINASTLVSLLDEVKKLVNVIAYGEQSNATKGLCISVMDSLETARNLAVSGYPTTALNSGHVIISYLLLKRDMFQ